VCVGSCVQLDAVTEWPVPKASASRWGRHFQDGTPKPTKRDSGVGVASHLMNSGRGSFHIFSGPIRRRTIRRAIFGSARRSAFHCSVRCSKAARRRSMFTKDSSVNPPGTRSLRGRRNFASMRAISVSRSLICGARVCRRQSRGRLIRAGCRFPDAPGLELLSGRWSRREHLL
jgi:hypothetical protein